MSKALDAKHEKILKSLLRIPDNKRCMNCDTLGPQYVVGELQIFVCTICSGVHRQFSHRVKGISMSTFKPEEMKALEAGGNGVAAQVYLNKWRPTELQKPVDRNTTKIKDWIDAVYVKKRFYSAEAASSASRTAATQAQLPRRSISSTSSAGDEVPIVNMGTMLGDGFKLQVVPNPGHFVGSTPNGVNSRATSTASSRSHDSPAPAHVNATLVNILDEPLAPSELKEEPPSENWDAFGAPAPPQQPQTHLPPVQEGAAWSAFDQLNAAPVKANAYPAAAAPTANGNQAAPWSAFGFDGHAEQQQQQQPASQPQQSSQQQQQAQQAGPGRAAQPAPPAQPAKPPARQELPLDLFGDGLLGGYSAPPSIAGQYGQQRPQPAYQYAASPGAYQQPPPYQQPQAFQQQQQQPYTQPGYAQQSYAQQGYGQQQQQQPQPYQQPAAGNKGSGAPFGASFDAFGSNLAASRGASGGLSVAPRSSSDATGSGEVSMPDPFSGLVPSLGGALPSVSRHTSTSSSQSVHDMPGRSSFANIPSIAQPFGMATQQAAPAHTAAADPFSNSSGYGQSVQSSSFPVAATDMSRPPPKSSGNPFA